MSDTERQLAILLQALVKSDLKYICPRCYRLFSDITACYRHCRDAGEDNSADDIHKAECDLPLGVGRGRRSYDKCFAVEFVLEKCRESIIAERKLQDVSLIMDTVPSRDTMDAMWLAVIKI
ncbi:unnamed protein product [Penicillium salamii]|uniref:C2H2-type domain-containing protein n=1 Tax=Penicillium salamii TaxID=1612424 RepID=A0A9W4NCD7_9EURO|nr:unnamed protein product [Penicillium salamii]CAG7985070.1 unnamed protein product [Penicillium salamii]CAG7994785.1 unnamed protein product [Penicillium salamii]CAG7995284.1 unnamed protein product [Penicillium salamii]CAG8023591.1 unnamed protein product [Penicillium salamii]